MTHVVGIIPFWSRSDSLNWDSMYSYLVRVMPVMAKLRPDWAWVVFWPMGGYGRGNWNWQDDGYLASVGNLTLFPWPYDTSAKNSTTSWNSVRYGEFEEQFGADILWIHQSESAIFAYGGYKASFNTACRPVIVLQHHYIIHRSLPYPRYSMLTRLMLQMASSIAADSVVCNSEHTRRMMTETFSEYLNEATLNGVLEKTRVIRFGLMDFSEWPTVEANFSVYNRPVIVYNHRQESYKHPEITARVISQLRREGLKFEVWTTTGPAQRTILMADRYVGHPDYRQYLKAIAVPAINVTNSSHETYCISMAESIALGHLPVAPRGVTFPELVPPDYPFLFSSVEEQVEMLRHIISTWPEEYLRWSPRLLEFARANYDVWKYAEAYLQHMESLSPSMAKTPARDKVLRAFNSLPSGKYALQELKRVAWKVSGCLDQAMTPIRVVRHAIECGFKPVVSPTGLVLVKP